MGINLTMGINSGDFTKICRCCDFTDDKHWGFKSDKNIFCDRPNWSAIVLKAFFWNIQLLALTWWARTLWYTCSVDKRGVSISINGLVVGPFLFFVVFFESMDNFTLVYIRQPIAVSDISICICLIDIRSKSKEQLNEGRTGLSSIYLQQGDIDCVSPPAGLGGNEKFERKF